MPRQQPPFNWAMQAARIHHRADVADRQEVDERDHAGLDVHFHLGEPDHERRRCRRRGDTCPWPRPSAPARRAPWRLPWSSAWMSVGQLVAVVAAAERDGARRRLGVGEAARRVAARGRRARRRARSPRARRRDPARQSAAACAAASSAPARLARVMAWVVWLPTDMHVHGRPLAVLPHTHLDPAPRAWPGRRRRRAPGRCTECVPRLPTPDCTCSMPSGRMSIRPS